MNWKKVIFAGVMGICVNGLGYSAGAADVQAGSQIEKVNLQEEKEIPMSTAFIHERGTWFSPKEGRVLTKEELYQKIDQSRVVLIGETHTNYEIHRWQLGIISGMYSRYPKMVVGFEMFPRRLDPALNEWVEGKLTKEEFLIQAEWDTVWKYDSNLYMPIFDFCRQNRIPMVGINCRRDLVTRVGKEGWEAIPEEDRDGLSPAKPASQEYRDHLTQLMSGMGGQMPMRFSMDHFVRAQQTWDRAFASNIAKVLKDDPEFKVVGIIGKGHLEYGYGVPYQLVDLGIEDVLVLIPSFEEEVDLEKVKNIGDGLFRLDQMDN